MVSKGLAWPDGRGDAPTGDTLIANAEDGAADTLKPRLLAMGADCSRIHVLDCVRRPGADGTLVERGFSLADVGDLEDAVRRLVNCRAVVIDPVSAFLADADEHRNGKVRGLLKPLARLAEQCGVAVILITHLTKNGSANSVHRMIGSIAFAGAARSVWMVAKDGENPTRRLMLLAKCNIAADEGGLAYSIRDGALVWERDPVTMSADDALAVENGGGEESKPGPEPEARKAAEEWLGNLLADGEVEAAKVKAEAQAAGLVFRTVQRAADAMGVIREKNQFSGGWQWRFPKPNNEGDNEGDRFSKEKRTCHLSPSQNQPENADLRVTAAQDDKFNYPVTFDKPDAADDREQDEAGTPPAEAMPDGKLFIDPPAAVFGLPDVARRGKGAE